MDLFNAVNLSTATFSNFRTSMPKADTLAKIADYLDVSVDYLLGRSPDKGSNFEFWKKFNRLSERDKLKLELRAEDMLQESEEH